MQKRQRRRYIPDRPSYIRRPLFKKGADGPRGTHHHFRIPGAAGCARLASLLVDVKRQADASGVSLNDEASLGSDIRNMRHVVATVETAAAVVGVCWWHPDYDLEVNEKASWRDFPDLRDYGALVGEELEDAGYSSKEVGELLTFLAVPILEVVGEAQIQDAADFTEGGESSSKTGDDGGKTTTEDSPTKTKRRTKPRDKGKRSK